MNGPIFSLGLAQHQVVGATIKLCYILKYPKSHLHRISTLKDGGGEKKRRILLANMLVLWAKGPGIKAQTWGHFSTQSAEGGYI